MAIWESVDDKQDQDFLYVEEVNSNDGLSRRLTGVKTSQTVQDLQKLIALELNNPQAWSSISIAFADKELTDYGRTLSSFGIQDGDTLYFMRSEMSVPQQPPTNYPPSHSGPVILDNIFFKDIDNKTYTLHQIPISWTVAQLRKKLGNEKPIEAEYCRFLWGGKQLEDKRTLEDYGLGKDCTIHIVMRLLGGLQLA